VEIDDEMNATMLFVASHDCATLCEASQPPEIQAYNLWFIATRFPRDGESTCSELAEQERYDEIIAAIDRAYPGLRNAPLSEQKEVGTKMILDAKNLNPIGSG
jgi:hypothetical protein